MPASEPAWWKRYPRPFWVLVGGMLLSMAGTSMVWPFLPLYITERLRLGLAQVGLLITVQAVAGIPGAMLAGWLTDTWGRKPSMVLGLLGLGLAYFGMNFAQTWWDFALTLALGGLMGPAFRIGGDAMVADLFPPQERDHAYAVVRIASNLGIAVGPAIGGILVMVSYSVALTAAASILALYASLVLGLLYETRPQTASPTPSFSIQEYRIMLRDGRLQAFLAVSFLVWMAGSVMWIFLGVYMRDVFGFPEQAFGFVVTTNAGLVTAAQMAITTMVHRRRAYRTAMALGAALYGVALASVAYVSRFWGFLTAMVILTFGEMLMVPTASTWVAHLAPERLRGRYMSSLSLLWTLGSGIASPLGGWLTDRFSFRVLWWSAALAAFLAALGYLPQRPPMHGETAPESPATSPTAPFPKAQAPAPGTRPK